ncbi:MAG: MarR family winged helix-turn-helix transcriptional regulator [Bacteroidota bacterium]
MHSFHLLQALLPLLETYQSQTTADQQQVNHFASWLYRQQQFPNMTQRPEPDPEELAEAKDSQAETALTMLISFLYRHAKHYSKKALDGTPLSTMDDFTFLATLSYQDSLTKPELIQQHLLEITSGIEIIKRLSKQGLLETFADSRDRRSKRVRLTTKGREVLEKSMKTMDQVAHIMAGDLPPEDRASLLPMLYQLNDFHAIVYQQDKKASLDEVEEKYLGTR